MPSAVIFFVDERRWSSQPPGIQCMLLGYSSLCQPGCLHGSGCSLGQEVSLTNLQSLAVGLVASRVPSHLGLVEGSAQGDRVTGSPDL